MFKSDISITKRITARRAGYVLIALSLIAVILLFNIVKLDVILYEHYMGKTFDQITTTSALKAERGVIYDSDMNILASTKTTWRIFVSPKNLRNKEKKDGVDYTELIAKGISEIFGSGKEKIYQNIKKASTLDLTLIKKADEEEYKRLSEYIKKNSLEDILLSEAQTERYYPMGTLAAHVLGFTGSDNQGLYGLEYSYNSTLAGKDGYYLYAKDASGNPMPGEYSGYYPEEDGLSIVTTIDTYLQEELEGIIEEIRINHSVTNRVTGILMDTTTGAVLAMATSSPFDPNSPFTLDDISQQKLENSGLKEGSTEYKQYKNELMQIMWSNKAISETYEPGSTFKIITVSAALDSGKASMSDTFSCPGYHMVGGWRIRCHKTTGHGHGFPLSYGLQMSCNPTMMVLAERVGAETFYSYVERFGYFEKTGIDLPSEASTIFHDLEKIGSTELATASFGQRFKVSIINQLRAVAAVANGGSLVEPYLVERIVDQNGNTVSVHTPNITPGVISEAVAREVADVLEKGVSGDGGAKNAYVDGYAVAAKTGTSQKFDILDENGNSYLRIGSTVAFAPSNEGGIAAIIVVDEPQSSVKYGSVVAAPYISKLLAKALPHLDYKMNKEPEIYTTQEYTGMTVSDVKKELDKSNIKYSVIGGGMTVISQVPAANISILKNHSTVYLYTEKRDEEYIVVPDVRGKKLSEANAVLASLGFNITVNGSASKGCTTLTVLSQNLPAGARVPIGTAITIAVLSTDFED